MIVLPLTAAGPDAPTDTKPVVSQHVPPAAMPAPAQSASESGYSDSVSSGFGTDGSPSPLLPDRLINYVVRMVTPLQREFGRSLDVGHFQYDALYAKEIIALALTSKDARLRAYATFLDMQVFSIRQAANAGAPPAAGLSAPVVPRGS